MTDIAQRKTDHLDLATSGDVGFKQTTTLLECVRLVHNALPELHFDELDLSLELFGKRLKAPIIIAAMTGGTERAGRINRELAAIAEERGYGFGLGSQRAMHKRQDAGATYQVRDVAPHAVVLGNVGVVQAAAMSVADLTRLVETVRADALCVHLNPAMELVQPEGDRDFRGGLQTFERLVRELPVPVVAKETGCGLSAQTAARLREAGVAYVDVSGAGGTSWVAVETHRATADRKALGEAFWDWGIPTAVSTAWCARAGFRAVIATGGITSGLDVAKAVALGASACGIARPVLQALETGGREAALRFLQQVELELRSAMLLVGARTLGELAAAPRIISGGLRDWLSV